MEERKLNIFEKLLAITSELSRVAKNLEVGYGANKYKATGEADVLAAIKPLEKEYGIYSYPAKREIVETAELETKSGTKNLFLRIATTYKFVNVENPAESIEITSYGDGVDSQDKSVGKAMTYSDKYALMKAYKIITGDDPDQNLSEELKGKYKAQNKPNYASSKSNQVNTGFAPFEPETGEPMNDAQKKIIDGLDQKLKDHACKKYGLGSIEGLTKAQAGYIIQSLIEKGILKNE